MSYGPFRHADANSGRGDHTQAIVSIKRALELGQANKGAKPNLQWILPENSVDWDTDKVINYVKNHKEFNEMRKFPEFQALLEV